MGFVSPLILQLYAPSHQQNHTSQNPKAEEGMDSHEDLLGQRSSFINLLGLGTNMRGKIDICPEFSYKETCTLCSIPVKLLMFHDAGRKG